MSIFRDTFKTEISGSLAARQKAMTDRNSNTIQYLGSRNSWIRMVSSVNINNINETARKNVLQGGALNNKVVNSKDNYIVHELRFGEHFGASDLLQIPDAEFMGDIYAGEKGLKIILI
jgi:Tfp pilus assembly protein FimT